MSNEQTHVQKFWNFKKGEEAKAFLQKQQQTNKPRVRVDHLVLVKSSMANYKYFSKGFFIIYHTHKKRTYIQINSMYGGTT